MLTPEIILLAKDALRAPYAILAALPAASPALLPI
jgi:hypothetical protein